VRSVLIGVGNPFRRDDGIGPALAGVISSRRLPGVEIVTSDGEPSALLDAWTGAGLAVVVDAVWCDQPVPGRVHRGEYPGTWPPMPGSASTHGLGLAEAVRLGEALDRLPGQLVFLGVEGIDYGHGPGLSPPLTAALNGLAESVASELGQPRPS
jgi:hydrogenase maturation protease